MFSSCSSHFIRLARRRTNVSSSLSGRGAIRHLTLQDWHIMDLLKSHGIRVPDCELASTPDEAMAAAENLGIDKPKDVVIKAQVLSRARSRGKFQNGFEGGIHTHSNANEIKETANKMLNQQLVTPQAPQGLPCNKVLLMERILMRREMYFSIVMDRATQSPVIVASPRSGRTIQEIAELHPELIYTEDIDLMDGLQEDQSKRIVKNLGLEEGTEGFQQAKTIISKLYTVFDQCDCTLVEVNPLAETPEGEIVVCDAKINFDDFAKYRQPLIFERRDRTQEDPRESFAIDNDMNYVGLDGNIGIMVNGAGLAMSTMDLIQNKGGNPANFLELRGGANESQVQQAFEILNGDPMVKVVLVNIFGGIMRCDVIAAGIINAAQQVGIQKPVVIRLQGNNVDAARTLIDGCGFKMILADDLEEAAEKAVGVAEISMKAEKLHVGVEFEGLGL